MCLMMGLKLLAVFSSLSKTLYVQRQRLVLSIDAALGNETGFAHG